MSGRWIGEYSYHPSDAYDSLPVPVRFTLTAQPRWLGWFRGEVRDDPTMVPAGEARISGRVSGWSVRFDKQYANLWFWYKGRYVPLSEFLDRELQMPLDADVASELIRYRGEYNPDEQTLRGTWELVPRPLVFYSNGQMYILPAISGSGDWHARREFG
jgi:hypothetical protein